MNKVEHPTNPMKKYEYINNVIDEDTGKELRYCQLCKHTKYKET